ncbi:uncharacterized protein LOC126549387 isoform X2 [Aphis gossypii]|uniref:uncharacterized protein LOC126549387 isoform X2 n=1 Tax=Aphis gossypii TaxID=80765 RepID=UPI002159841F|nr:uncharacterized protein LOC126549387 isoform X2 [Aphis gossypii]
MKMLIFSKCRLFITFLTFCYIFDNTAYTEITCDSDNTAYTERACNSDYYNGHPRKKMRPILDKLKNAGFSGQLEEDVILASQIISEKTLKETQKEKTTLRDFFKGKKTLKETQKEKTTLRDLFKGPKQTHYLFTNSCDLQGFTSYLTVQYMFSALVMSYKKFLENGPKYSSNYMWPYAESIIYPKNEKIKFLKLDD